MKTGRERVGQKGIALLEVIVAAVVVAIAAIGIALLLSRAQTAVVGQGDRYVALYLAQQKVESLISLALTSPPTGFDAILPMGTTTETSLPKAGEALTPGGAAVQTFTRTTCINFVLDDDTTSPAGCTDCTLGGSCTRNTKRITVTVTPLVPDVSPDPVTLVSVVTRHPANN